MQNSYRGRSAPRYTSYKQRSAPRRGPKKQYIDPSRFIKKAVATDAGVYESTHAFGDFKLNPRLQELIKARGYLVPTPIQDQAIPKVLEGLDVIGIANTGTGKTAAFILPLINKLMTDPRQQVLIMAPTRELALQIQDEFKAFSTGLGLYSTLCIGGTSIYRQVQELRRRPQCVIGTPGRLKDLIERRSLMLHSCQNVVLDEVDRMVDMGFINDMKAILKELATPRQSLFFTATTNPKVEEIMRTFLHNPVTIAVKTGETLANVDQDVVRIGAGQNKIDVLHNLLKSESLEKILVFGDTKRGVENISKSLNAGGIKAVSIHGNKSQSQRQRALLQFREDGARVMVATDVAARGLDIDDISHVINFDTPQTYDDYVHRIGRAGRAGKPGSALTFIA